MRSLLDRLASASWPLLTLVLAQLLAAHALSQEKSAWTQAVESVAETDEHAEQERRLKRVFELARTKAQERDARFLRASVRMEQKRYELAHRDFAAVTGTHPKHLEAWLGLATAQVELKRWKDARASFDRSLEIDPKKLRALYGIGEIYRLTKRDREARAFYERALEQNPRHVPSLYALALCALGLREHAKSWLYVRRSLEIDPKHAPTLRVRDAVTRRLSPLQLRSLELEANTLARPEDSGAWRQLTRFHLDLLQFLEAARVATNWRDAQPDDLEAQRMRGTALFLGRSFAAAAAQFRLVLRRAPSDHFSALVRFRALVAMGLSTIAQRDLALHLERAANRGEGTWHMLLAYLVLGNQVSDEQRGKLRSEDADEARVQALELEYFVGPAPTRSAAEGRAFRAELEKTRALSDIALFHEALALGKPRALDSLDDWVGALPDDTEITLPSGIFRSEGTPLRLHQRRGLKLRGATTGGGTRLVQLSRTSVSPALVISDCQSIVIRGIRVLRVGTATQRGRLLVLSKSRKIQVHNCEFANGSVGVEASASESLELVGCRFRDCSALGLALDAVRTLSLRGNSFVQVGQGLRARELTGKIDVEANTLDGAAWKPLQPRAPGSRK